MLRSADFAAVAPLRQAVVPQSDSFTTKRRGRRAAEERLQWDRGRFDAAMARIGECSVRQDPAAAHALVVALPMSPGELAALKGLRPALSACVPAGSTITLETGYVRGVLARIYWRLADEARLQPAG